MARTPAGSIELLSFRRTFALLITLVVVPSAALSGFGVLAIINERAAVEKKLEEVWSVRLREVSDRLKARLDAATVKTEQPLVMVSASGQTLTDASFEVKDGAVETADAKLKAAVGSLAGELQALPARPIFFSIATPQGSFVVVALRHDGQVQGARVSQAALDALTDEVSQDHRADAQFSLRPVKREPQEGIINRLVSNVADVKEAALGQQLASVTMPYPLQDFQLTAVAEGEDPVSAASTRNRVVYGVLLGLFYVTLIIGVVFTGRALYREARLSRLKTDFVSLISHELRTPLTSIRMFIEMLALGRVKSQADTQQVLDMLSQETARLSGMIEGVLDFARIEGGTRRYEKKPLPVTEVVDAAVTAFRTQRVGAKMDLKVEVQPALPPVEVDRDAIAGALLNLLNNAFKYTATDDKQIVIAAKPDKHGVAISVADNGVGIPKSEQRRVFDRFYRVDNLLTRTTEGSGLGLAISQRIVQGHGGKIQVASEPGRGSTFTVHLPAAKEPQPS